jgi:integrase
MLPKLREHSAFELFDAMGLAWFALALMAGIRPVECDRIQWRDVGLDRGIVTVDAAASKVCQRRVVHIQPAAVSCLQLAKMLDAQLPLQPTSRRRLLRQVRDKLRFVAWPKDFLRHTCASYMKAAWQDAPRVAAELGNSVDIPVRHSRELCERRTR